VLVGFYTEYNIVNSYDIIIYCRLLEPGDISTESGSFLKDGKLNVNHRYWTQVQGQMAVTGLQWADFVVYTHRYKLILLKVLIYFN
jgi:hypothetical protein